LKVGNEQDRQGKGGVVLPPGVVQAWGLEPERRRGPKPALTLADIVAAAIDLADAEGLAAVSMQGVAKRLKFTAMSLYRYVSSKDDLLALMMDAAFGDPPPEIAGAPDWRTGCEAWAVAALERYRQHAWVLDIPISSMPMLPHQMLWLEVMLGVQRDTRLSGVEKLSVALLVSTYVMNVARLERDLLGNPQFVNADTVRQFEDQLQELLPPDTYPFLLAAVQERAFSEEEYETQEFRFGLDRILDGVEVLVRQMNHDARRG
jgi:AcrR family transcriptional regulator